MTRFLEHTLNTPYDIEWLHECRRSIKSAISTKKIAKPLIASFEHTDCITCLCTNKKCYESILTGTLDGQICLWNTTTGHCYAKLEGNKKNIRGLSMAFDGNFCVSCSDDQNLYAWNDLLPTYNYTEKSKSLAPILKFAGKHSFRDIDNHCAAMNFVTVGTDIEVWDYSRQDPLYCFPRKLHSTTNIRFNLSEKDVFATSEANCTIKLYDLRIPDELKIIHVETQVNAIAWAPFDPFSFTSANDDGKIYLYDMRNLKAPSYIYRDFTHPVLDVAYSPSGKEIVAGGYDCSIRIFPSTGGPCRDLYHTNRMQRVFCVKFSLDSKYIFSGSDDMNIRMWKSEASQRLYKLSTHEMYTQSYERALLHRYYQLPDVKKFICRKFVTKKLYKNTRLKRISKPTKHIKLAKKI